MLIFQDEQVRGGHNKEKLLMIDPAKRILVNNFTANEDYKILLILKDENSLGGRPKEQILMNL